MNLRRRDGRGRSGSACSSRGLVAGLRFWTDMSSDILKASECWWGRVLNRVAVFAAAPCATLLVLLLELLLFLCVGKTKTELHSRTLRKDTVEISDDTLCNLPSFESATVSFQFNISMREAPPSETNFFAETRRNIAANFGWDGKVR